MQSKVYSITYFIKCSRIYSVQLQLCSTVAQVKNSKTVMLMVSLCNKMMHVINQ